MGLDETRFAIQTAPEETIDAGRYRVGSRREVVPREGGGGSRRIALHTTDMGERAKNPLLQMRSPPSLLAGRSRRLPRPCSRPSAGVIIAFRLNAATGGRIEALRD